MDFIRKVIRMEKYGDSYKEHQQQASNSGEFNDSLLSNPDAFDPDHPVSSKNKGDRLGFRSVAKKLAASLLTQTTSHGLVVSIEGTWGSGKSSLANLLIDELKRDEERGVEIVRFEPWLVGDRDAMLIELMSELATAVEAIQSRDKDQQKDLNAEAKRLADQLREYASKLSHQTAPLVQLAGILGLPGGEVAGKALRAASESMASSNVQKPLPQVKEELTKKIYKLPCRIVVVIDDLDRLEPQEAVEIMRLIRAVADFPNIVYVLCYDPRILADSLKSVLSIDDGSAFLEKVVQVRFTVPKPEAFDLRRWLLEECQDLYTSMLEAPLSDDQTQRLLSVCDVEGALLTTPRDVVRAMNAIKLYWPPVSSKIDFPDLVWLQMVKIENDDLYTWIEQYLVEFSAVSDGALIREEGRAKLAAALKKHVKDELVGSARSMWTFKQYLPGIRPGSNIEDKSKLFNLENKAEISSFERDRRLGSPQHSRYYFAFSKPAAGLEDIEFDKFMSSAEAGEDLESYCNALIQEQRPQGGTKFDLLVDRLQRLEEGKPSSRANQLILMALANCMDRAVDGTERGRWGVRWPWRTANSSFGSLLAKLPAEDRDKTIRDVFGSGKAIGWLMSGLIRQEIFAHGRYGNQPKPEESRIFSDGELDQAIGLLLQRLKTTDRNKIVDTPEVLSLMYGWMQAGDVNGVQEWVREQEATDAGFLKLLSVCRGWMASDKVYYPLNRRDLEHFMDFDKALERLRGISDNTDKSKEERDLADELLEAARLGEDN